MVYAQEKGIDVLSNPYGVSVLNEFAKIFSYSIKKLDGLYYALVELQRMSTGKKVPAAALNTVISAAGRMGQIDRSFATFDEYNTIFGLEHNVHSYNSLLRAMRYHKFPQLPNCMSILQQMEVMNS
jgi:hypothetical protein